MRIVRISLLLFLSLTTVSGDNWPQWRGPQLNNVSADENLPVKWSPTENVAWRLEMPDRSGSTPIIWGDYVFLNTAHGDQLQLWAINRGSGEVLWKRDLGGGNERMRKQNMSSPSPVTDGTIVWVLTGTGVLKAFDFEGTEIWSRNIQEDYGAFGLNWGYASSPLLYEGALFVQVLHGMKTDEPSYLLRIDKDTGKTVWKTERPTDAIMESPDAYTTPNVIQVDGETHLVVSGGDYVTGHDLHSGEELWRVGGMNPQKNPYYRVVASPTVEGEMIYVPTRVKPFQALKQTGDGFKVAWTTENGPDVPTPVSDGQYLYIINDKGIAYAFDRFTGETVWGPERIPSGTYSSSPVLADGKIYITSEDGITTVLKAGAEFEILAENDLGGYVLSSVAPSDGQLFIRTDQFLYAIGQRN